MMNMLDVSEWSKKCRNTFKAPKKFQTASSWISCSSFQSRKNESTMGIIFGSTDCSMQEALDSLTEQNLKIDAMRLRAFPFNLEVWEFIEDVIFYLS